MTRKAHDHISIAQAGSRGMTLSEWCEHEAREEALDVREGTRLGWVLLYTLAGVLITSVSAIVLWLPYVPA